MKIEHKILLSNLALGLVFVLLLLLLLLILAACPR